METKNSGIVLGGVSFGENDKIISVLTPDDGVVSAKIKGVKKAGAKLKFAAEPFCFAEYVFAVSGNKRTVTGASLVDSFYPIRENLHKFFAAGTVVEFARRFMKEGIVSPDIFLSVVGALKEIAYGEAPEVALVKFLIFALKSSGYALDLSGCASCGKQLSGKIYFEYGSGGFLCESCFNGDGREINFSTFAALVSIKNGEVPDPVCTKKALKLLDFYISNKAEENLKSLKELINLAI